LLFTAEVNAARLISETTPTLLSAHRQTGDRGIHIAVLSSRNDLVSGGDALVEISADENADREFHVTLNDLDVSNQFRHSEAPGRIRGLISGLQPGLNALKVTTRSGRTARLQLTNWPIAGPIISGPHEQPFVCMTQEFKLPATGFSLGPSIDSDCFVKTRVDYLYFSTQGQFKSLPSGKPKPSDVATIDRKGASSVPFIVRVETGVINRGVYQISMLYDPESSAVSPFEKPTGWNGALLYHFGGCCEGGMYVQGKNTAGVLEEKILRRGFAMASSSLNVYANNCDDLLAAETMMMVKERFIETFGPPTHTIGWGCSGGSYQAQQIGDNYPGLLDGIVVGCSFPDVGHAGVSVNSFAARLVYEYFEKWARVPWSKEEITAVAGLADFTALETAGRRNNRIDPKSVCSASIPVHLLYDPVRNPSGARCSIYDHGANGFGRNPSTGFGRRPLDNVGVQYGLGALNAGKISKRQFLDINRFIGGMDIDANHTLQRTTGDRVALRRGYETGRFLSTGGGLKVMPIIDYRAYADFKNGDNHQRFHSFSTRARLQAANGHIENHIMLTESDKYGLFSLESPQLMSALEHMEQWLTNLNPIQMSDRTREILVRARPADLVDACFTRDDLKISERQTYLSDTKCNQLYPSHANPHIVAGQHIANDVVKCRLRRVDRGDYSVTFDTDEFEQIKRIFPQGVCDYSRRGEEQRPVIGTWISFGPAR
jgi:hypothetical protein